MKNKTRIIAFLFIIIGIIILSYPMISNFIITRQGLNVIKNYDEKVDKLDIKQIDNEFKKAASFNNGLLNELEYDNIFNIDGLGLMGYIEIPKIGIKLPIYHGTDNDVMSKGVGHLKKSSLPTFEPNIHAAFTSHTGFAKAKLFNDLDKLKIDDVFYIYILDKVLKYKVVDINIVLPNDIEKLKIQKDRNLATLITCTPYGKNTHRLLVTGELEDEEQDNIIKEKEKVKENITTVKISTKKEYKVYIILLTLAIVICILIILKLS